MEGDNPTLDSYRTGYISERWNVSDNCAKALQLFELGFSVSGAAKRLPVTESTVSGYHSQLMETIHPDVVFTLTQSSKKFDVWGDRNPLDAKEYNYADGVADAQMVKEYSQSTDRQSQIDPSLRDRERTLNRGIDIEAIPQDLITIAPNVEIQQ